MSTPESIASAFARGLVEAMLTSSKPEKQVRPKMIEKAAVTEAVRQVVGEMLAQEAAPTAPQMDLFTQDIENVPEDPMADAILRRVHEAQARAEYQDAARNGEIHDDGTYDPNEPERSQWTSPVPR
jgi:hypothetical protein